MVGKRNELQRRQGDRVHLRRENMIAVVEQILAISLSVAGVDCDGAILIPELGAGAAQADIRKIAVTHRFCRHRAVLQGASLAELIPFVIEEEERFVPAVIYLGKNNRTADGAAVNV